MMRSLRGCHKLYKKKGTGKIGVECNPIFHSPLYCIFIPSKLRKRLDWPTECLYKLERFNYISVKVLDNFYGQLYAVIIICQAREAVV